MRIAGLVDSGAVEGSSCCPTQLPVAGGHVCLQRFQ